MLTRCLSFRTLAWIPLALLALATPALAGDCSISGTITAEHISDPGLPPWQYTLVLTWDTGSPYALSHANLLMDIPGGTCTCQNFYDALYFLDPIGTSDGDPSCTVDYRGYIECNGDPSIPGVDGILLKFEPIEGQECEPGNTGTGTFVFYSNLGPAPVDEDLLSLVDKFGQNHCFGYLAGDFPSMPCDPVDNEAKSWGTVKGFFR